VYKNIVYKLRGMTACLSNVRAEIISLSDDDVQLTLTGMAVTVKKKKKKKIEGAEKSEKKEKEIRRLLPKDKKRQKR